MPAADAQHNLCEMLPERFRPFARLMRLDRPIGTWLVLWPCLWSLILAARLQGHLIPEGHTVVLVTAGAILMRGAGCTLNDIVDRRYDRCVRRTMNRPLASGEISVTKAVAFLFVQLICAFEILFSFSKTTIQLGLAIVPIVCLYPFMKRVTFWPQLWLGLTFNWGAILGWSIQTGSVDTRAVLLYLAGTLWTLGYDTIYAHQDREDDELLGLKSTALLLGQATKTWLGLFYSSAWLLITCAHIHLSLLHILLSLCMLAHLSWQVRRLDIHSPGVCLRLFRSNREFGLIAALYLAT